MCASRSDVYVRIYLCFVQKGEMKTRMKIEMCTNTFGNVIK